MLLPFPGPVDDHEAWFADHYADLVRWAAQITAGDRDQAEDLVHDVFVHFMANRPDLHSIENVNGYLYTSLRNLHLSNARRSARRQETVVALGDFDVLDHNSLGASLRAVEALYAADRRDRFEHQLRAIWRYAQVRKQSSKTASVLTLRFFHGYYPEEIALILRVSRDTVDQLLSQARKEARQFITCPEPPCAVGTAVCTKGWPAGGLLSPPDLAMALHKAALRSDTEGVCLGEADLAALYPPTGVGPSVQAPRLAHIVSCHACLDRVTRRLGLPPLAERHPLDSLGYDRDPKPPRGGLGGGTTGDTPRDAKRSTVRRRMEAGRRRLADLLAYEPTELRVSINGVVLGSQQITSAVSRLTLRPTAATADFLEIFSEKDARLLFLSLEAPPRGPVLVRQTVTLDGGRRVEACVDFAGTSPVVHVEYVDPGRADVPAAVPPPPVPAPAHRPLTRRLRTWARALSAWLGRVGPHRWRPSRGSAFTTLVVVTAVGAVLLNQLGRPVLSAAELLQKSSDADAAWQADTAHAIRRTIEMEARSRDTGTTMRRRVEVWQSATHGLTVRRVYDEQDRLLAGEWIETDGTRTVHRAATAAAADPIVQGVEAWRFDPSAVSFTRLVGAVDHATVTRDADRFRVSFDNANAPAGQTLLSASLTLGDDWRGVEQRAALGTTEFIWTERSWTRQPADSVPAAIFEIDTDLAAPVIAPPAARVVVPPATAGLEIAARTALRWIDADLGEEVQVRRANGRLSVTGVVASAERQAQIQSVLADVARHPAVQLRIETVDEVHARARPDDATTRPLDPGVQTQSLVFGPPQIPAHEAIRAYLVTSGVPAPEVNSEIMRVAHRLVQQTTRMRVHAWALRTLLQQIGASDVVRLDATERRQWRALIAEHGRGFSGQAAALRRLLTPVYPDGASSGSTRPTDSPLESDDRVRQASAQFVESAADLDAQLVAAFTIPTAGAPVPSLDAHRFWTKLTQAVTLASALDRSAERFPSSQR